MLILFNTFFGEFLKSHSTSRQATFSYSMLSLGNLKVTEKTMKKYVYIFVYMTQRKNTNQRLADNHEWNILLDKQFNWGPER